jgi:hypothetical protein
MKSRCSCVTASNYSLYGQRGITYVESWETYDNFLADMGKRPEKTTLDRIDPNKGYCKENCRWATSSQQQKNRRNCLHLTYNGITKTSAEWSRDLGLAAGAVWQRVVKFGWPVEKAVTAHKGARL